MSDWMLASVAIFLTIAFLAFVAECIYYENNTPEKQKMNAEASQRLQESINISNYGVPYPTFNQLHRK
ncbi:hypothetical protein [Schleiferilactobacillus harbinensis]|uniref:hypothetical protein n=1 Tax=Schleiferilactobacillus harbinensis TaxID=304207 RepID=UPI0011705506|nr:hypothetical protein [Schleiferilactobacillus harbinensis]GEK05355.1 hypothetical protein LHA01_05940 [Schleiferilactobacillus harbinensis]